MPDILHKVGIKSSSLDYTYKALTTREGLSAWWTTDTQGESKVGGVLQFRFGAGGFDIKVLERHPAKHVPGGKPRAPPTRRWRRSSHSPQPVE